MPIATINPATAETLKIFAALTVAEIESKLARAHATFLTYRCTTFAERAAWLNRTAEILADEKRDIALILTLEMGKTLKSAVAEIEKCARACRYYAEHGAKFLADEEVESDAARSYIKYQPLGVVLAVMPWNFPFWQVFRFAAPALMAGNVGLLKHASNVPQCALKIEDVLTRAGFPAGAFQALLVGADAIENILSDERVAAATLTGSEPAGSAVAATAGKYIKKTVLELGGSDPFIVMPSADLPVAAKTAAQARCQNNGQSCIAAKRFIAHAEIYDEFRETFTAEMNALVVGDPLDEKPDVGALATGQILKDIEDQVARAIKAGAQLLTGGKRLGGAGYFYPPTVLEVDAAIADAEIFKEEFFAPVALLFKVADKESAVELADATTFGLGSSVWTNDAAEQDFFAAEITAGQVFFNGMVASDPRLPFGGVKHSGYGRELGAHGIREFVNIKTVWIK